MAVLYHIQNQNERQKRDLDETFLERKQMEEQLTDLEENINHINLVEIYKYMYIYIYIYIGERGANERTRSRAKSTIRGSKGRE